VSGGRRLCECLHFGQHFFERADAREVKVDLGLSRFAQVGMRVVEPGKDKGAGVGGIQIAQNGFWPSQPPDLVIRADRQNFSPADRHRLHGLRLVLGESHARVNHAIEKDHLRRGGLSKDQRS
jgi:hypothetical protein